MASPPDSCDETMGQAHADPDDRKYVMPSPIHKTPYGGTTLHLVQREDDRASQLRQT